MSAPVNGLHHLTAIATDAQTNIEFYAGLLGLRLVKRTVNFDDPSAYHLYYGDAQGTPGSIITFFYWKDARRGRIGSGATTSITFSVPPDSLEVWHDRLQRNGVDVQRKHRFGEDVLAFVDPDHIPIELVAVENDARTGWSGAGIAAEHAIRGMHTVELTVPDANLTEALLTSVMDHRLLHREGNRARFEAGPGGSGRYVDMIVDPSQPRGIGGTGTIHHIAFRVATDDGEHTMLHRLLAAGYPVSDIRDRDYFRSIYYRERNGILFEIATDVPGFAVDEPAESLGTTLKLPKQFHDARAEIEARLPQLRAARQFADSAHARS